MLFDLGIMLYARSRLYMWKPDKLFPIICLMQCCVCAYLLQTVAPGSNPHFQPQSVPLLYTVMVLTDPP